MKIKRYRWDELEKARELQKEAVRLHLPCPPVAWWDAKIFDEKGKLEEHIQCKCNSYTRNGLNLIAPHALYLNVNIRSSTIFGDGVISFKNTSGSLNTSVTGSYGYSTSQTVLLGTGTEEESIDNYAWANNLTVSPTIISTSFDGVLRKQLNTLGTTYANSSGSSVSVTEAGVTLTAGAVGSTSGALANVLVVRDLFDVPISVLNGKTLAFNYNFELAYP
jgi:hypothetical protein